VEVLTGVDPDADPGSPPRPEYDPAARSLAQREEAETAELAASLTRMVWPVPCQPEAYDKARITYHSELVRSSRRPHSAR
jgi:hypothetical protein